MRLVDLWITRVQGRIFKARLSEKVVFPPRDELCRPARVPIVPHGSIHRRVGGVLICEVQIPQKLRLISVAGFVSREFCGNFQTISIPYLIQLHISVNMRFVAWSVIVVSDAVVPKDVASPLICVSIAQCLR